MLQFFKGVSTISIYIQGAFGNTTGKHPQSVFFGITDAPNTHCNKRKKACGTEERMVSYNIIKLNLAPTCRGAFLTGFTGLTELNNY
jgi:hypothetical protein